MIDKQRIREEADAFFDWPTPDKSYVTTESALIFAGVIAEMARAEAINSNMVKKMNIDYEAEIAAFECARDEAMNRYFNARPKTERTLEREYFFKAGYRMAYEELKSESNIT